MNSEQSAPVDSATPQQRARRTRLVTKLVVAILAAYLLVAYLLMPNWWKVYVWRHPSMEDVPAITYTADHHPGDPLNVSLIGTEAEVEQIMQAAKWVRADRLGVVSDLKIAADTVLKRPDDDAPVSRLYLYGRPEDLAFENPVDNNPRQRNHVRFWRTDKTDPDGRPVWIGSATYDERVGFSHTTGEITHHIAADVDAERDNLFHDLEGDRQVERDLLRQRLSPSP